MNFFDPVEKYLTFAFNSTAKGQQEIEHFRSQKNADNLFLNVI